MSECLIDVVPGLLRGQRRDGRYVHDKLAKWELIRLCQQPGVSVAGMALAHGLNANLLHKWITVANTLRGLLASAAPVLLPVTTQSPAPASASDGANACPPEGVGGYPGYAEFLEVMADPRHEVHAQMLTLTGGAFDPKAFDLAEINRRLATIKP